MSKSNSSFAAFVLGLAAGWAITLFMPKETKEKSKKVIQEKVHQLKETLDENEQVATVKEIFGKKTKEATEHFHQFQDRFYTALAEVKGTWSEIDKDKYSTVLSNVVRDFRANRAIPETELELLKDYFSRDFKRIKKAAMINEQEKEV